MADTKEKIYRIKFEGMNEQLNNLVAIKKSVEDLNKAKKELDTTTDEGRKKQEEYILQIKNLNKQYQEQQKEIDKTDKANQKGADTLEKMRASLSLMRKELEKLPIGTKEYEAQSKAVERLQSKVNLADEATGRFQGNVGNYKNAITSAFAQMGISVTGVTEAIETAKITIVGMETATNKSAFAMKLLKLAIASTGIGLLIIALGELVAYFQSSGDRADKLAKILAPFKQLFNEIQTAIFGVIDAMIKANEESKGFVDSWKDLPVWAKMASVGFAPLIATIKAITWLYEKFNGAVGTEMQSLIDKQDEYDDAMRASLVENAKFERQRAELMTQLVSTDKDNFNKRKEIAQKILDMDDAQFNKKLLLAKENLRLTIESNKLNNDQSDEALINVENKTAELENLKTEQYQRGLKLQSRMATLLEQDVKQETKAADTKIKLIEKEIERRKELEDLRLKMMEEAQRIFDEQLAKTESENIEDYKKEVYVDPLMDPIVQAQIAQQEAIRNEIQKTADLEELTFQTKLRNFDNYAQMLNATKSLLSKNTAAYKAMATAEALISTYTAIAKTLKEPSLPWPSNVIMSAIIGAQGFMNVAQINKVKFAKGGIVGGQSHENGGTVYRGSDGQVFEAERGELITVVNRHDTERLRMLSAANSIHGRAFFASGGVMTPNSDFSDRKMRAIIQETVNSISNIPVVVSERDISKSQRRVSVIENAGNL